MAKKRSSYFPDITSFESLGSNEWGFKFPEEYFDFHEKLWELEEKEEIIFEKYEKELKKLLDKAPELFDAANVLASLYEEFDDGKKARQVYEEYYKKIKSFFPPKFIPGKHKAPWIWMDNRPFLRLLEGRANFIEKTNGISKAIPFYEELIALNPNDNQGIRESLSTAYLKTNRIQDLLRLCMNYPDDINAYTAATRILAAFKLGKMEDAKKYTKHARKYKENIIIELLNTTHKKPKSEMEGYITIGGEEEAYYYWEDQGNFWENTKGALDFLRLHCPDLTKAE